MQFHGEQRHWAGAVVAGRLARSLLCVGHWSSLLRRACCCSALSSLSLRAVIVVVPCPSSSPRRCVSSPRHSLSPCPLACTPSLSSLRRVSAPRRCRRLCSALSSLSSVRCLARSTLCACAQRLGLAAWWMMGVGVLVVPSDHCCGHAPSRSPAGA